MGVREEDTPSDISSAGLGLFYALRNNIRSSRSVGIGENGRRYKLINII